MCIKELSEIHHHKDCLTVAPNDSQLIDETNNNFIADQHVAGAKLVPSKAFGSRQKSCRSKCHPKKAGTRICQSRKSSVEVVPTINDVLLGRGGKSNNHPGNRRYRQARDEIQPRYLKARKNMKKGICRELVNQVHSWSGRFLVEHEPKSGHWYLATDRAMAKSSQVLREHK
jgi:hypothetical protein